MFRSEVNHQLILRACFSIILNMQTPIENHLLALHISKSYRYLLLVSNRLIYIV